MSEGRAWTQDDVIRLVKMLRDGRTAEEAADALHRTAPAIWQYMRYHRQMFQGLPGEAGWFSQQRGKIAHERRSVHAPLPRLWRTHDRLSLPCVLG